MIFAKDVLNGIESVYFEEKLEQHIVYALLNYFTANFVRSEMAAPMQNTLTYEGCNFFRQRLILATLSGKAVKIKKIRYKDNDPGVRGKLEDRLSSNVIMLTDFRSLRQRRSRSTQRNTFTLLTPSSPSTFKTLSLSLPLLWQIVCRTSEKCRSNSDTKPEKSWTN